MIEYSREDKEKNDKGNACLLGIGLQMNNKNGKQIEKIELS